MIELAEIYNVVAFILIQQCLFNMLELLRLDIYSLRLFYCWFVYFMILLAAFTCYLIANIWYKSKRTPTNSHFESLKFAVTMCLVYCFIKTVFTNSSCVQLICVNCFCFRSFWFFIRINSQLSFWLLYH